MSPLLLSLALLVATAQAFYLPGIDPVSHPDNDNVTIDVNSLSSLSDIFPYDYYRLPFCKPRTLVIKPESLGEIMWGDKRQSSPYVVFVKQNQACVVLDCPQSNAAVVREQIDELETFINKGYRGHMSIDNLPMFHNGTTIATQRPVGDLQVPDNQRFLAQRGYALGVHKNYIGKTMINNHIHMTIKYHEETLYGKRVSYIVGFAGQPYSVKHADVAACNALFDPTRVDTPPLTVDDVRAGTQKVIWTYGVTWVNESKIRWASRWDSYFETSVADNNGLVHWQYIVSSLVMTFCMSLIASIILLRTLHRDFNRYNSPDPDDAQEEIGWKLVHRDVFRPPYHAPILAALVGNGAQVLLMLAGVLFFALLGFLSPANRGSLLTSMILLFVLMSFVAGYVCGKVMKLSSAPHEWKYVFVCGMVFPGAVSGSYFFSDLINASHGASDSVPFLTLLTVFVLWLCISVPLTVLGASLAFHQGLVAPIVPVGSLAREIPPQRLQFSAPLIYLVPPLAPLAAAFMELKFILSSLWQGTVYYVFGFLAIVVIVWAITAALTTIIVVYYMLCYENHRWWWSSFLIPGCLGLHLFVYTIYFFEQELDITSTAATSVYFIYMGLISAAYGVASGAIGFLSCIFFTRKIYGSIKID